MRATGRLTGPAAAQPAVVAGVAAAAAAVGAAVAVGAVAVGAVMVGAVMVVAAGGPAAAQEHSPDACPRPFNPPAPFPDRPTISDAHIRNVDCAYNHAIVAGAADGTFAPRDVVRRDQMASFLASMLEAAGHPLPAPSDQGFADVATSAHRDRIDQLARAGIVAGTGHGDRYSPRQPVRRDQMAAFLLRAAAWATGRDVVALHGDPDATGFTDVTALQAHGPAIAGAVDLGLARGRTPTRYAPKATVSRQQMGSFMVQALALLLVDAAGDADPGGFRGAARPLPAGLRARMEGVSWRPDCPVALGDLALLELTHHGFDGRPRVGELVVEARLAGDVLAAFERIYDAGFPIERMRLIEEYGGSDDRSMANNNTSAFNCRAVTGGGRFSEHAYGRALDINPVQNPYVRADEVEPAAGREYLDRGDVRTGMIVRPGPATDAFRRIGWGWGGDWRTLSDYMHFSENGR